MLAVMKKLKYDEEYNFENEVSRKVPPPPPLAGGSAGAPCDG